MQLFSTWSGRRSHSGPTVATTTAKAGRLTALRRLAGCRKGATAVEFGLIAVPLFGLLFVILETALYFWATQVLETAVANASRQIYTGQFQTDPANKAMANDAMRAEKFKQILCENVTALFDCSKLAVDIRPASSFGGAMAPAPITGGNFDASTYSYQTVGAKTIGIVRAAMEFPAWTAFLGNTQGLTNGRRIIMASSVFRTEPYQ